MRIGPYPLLQTDHINNLRECVLVGLEKTPDQPAYVYRLKDPIEVGRPQAKKDILAFATVLLEKDFRKKKVAIVATPGYPQIAAGLSALVGGAVMVPIDPLLPPEQIAGLIADCDAEALFYSGVFEPLKQMLEAANARLRMFVNLDTQFDQLREEGEAMLAAGSTKVFDLCIEPREPAVITYTSGTTGLAKGVVLPHDGYANAVMSGVGCSDFYGKSMLNILPFNHSFGVLVTLSVALYGYTMYISDGPQTYFQEIRQFGPDTITLVPAIAHTLYRMMRMQIAKMGLAESVAERIAKSKALWAAGEDKRRELFPDLLGMLGNNLNLIFCGAAPLDPQVSEFLRDIGVDLIDAYGLTECCSAATTNRRLDYKDGSVGRMRACMEARIVDKGADGVGSIELRGASVMLEYYKRPEQTKEVFTEDGWFITGDLGYFDEEGYLHIAGRSKNLILLDNGENVYPEELEFLASKDPLIAEIIVSDMDKVVGAEIYPAYPEGASEDERAEIRSRIEQGIAAMNTTQPFSKNILKVVFRDEPFPKTVSNKIRRHNFG